jgi:inner membrane protein
MNDIPHANPLASPGSGSALKLFLIGCIILALMIPVVWISSLIHERYNRRDSVTAEIASKWGSDQFFSGPFLSVPYYIKVLPKENSDHETTAILTEYLNFAPQTMQISGKIQSVPQHRGIFKVTGYKADLELTAVFSDTLDAANLPHGAELDWNHALVTFDLEDARGLKELTGSLNGQAFTFNKSVNVVRVASTDTPDNALKGRNKFTSDSDNDKERCFKFEAKAPQTGPSSPKQINIHLALTGTRQLSFLASGVQESVQLEGDWPSPSFTGDLLPDTRTVDAKGFTAAWQTNYLNTGVRQFWTSEEPTVRLSALGVNFLIMVDAYQQTTRTLKYSILFLLLTFMVFFFAETITKQRIHPIQYLMVGCSLVLFYLLLLSISEHLSFGWSYLIAALGVVLQISLYCYTILKTRKFALQVGSMLIGLYAFLYILLRLEDSALLVGSISLFVLLGIAMYAIRNVNWYGRE